jgi:energy-coupling factor transporter ATP-binding protein EcfA2
MPGLRVRAKLPDSPISWLIKKFREHLHIPDPAPLHVFYGALAANLIEGDPVWLMLVGPPGCGKTELLNSILGLDGVSESAKISGTAAFLSGTARKDISKDATGGILRQVGSHGAVVMNDFTSVLTLRKDVLDDVLSVFRECYSGRFTRDIGSEGGKKLHWDGKVAFFAGVTGAIDAQHEANSSLGERWIYFRMPAGDGFERTKRAVKRGDSIWREGLRESVRAFLAGLDLEFGKLESRRELTDKEIIKLYRMGKIAATCRSPVVRDRYTREIISARETESETRLVIALGQLLIGMEAIGVSEADRWKALGSVALDSMPKLRGITIDEIIADKSGLGVTYSHLAEAMGCSRTTAERTVEDLEVHKIVQREKIDGVVHVKFSEWMRDEYQKGWGNG